MHSTYKTNLRQYIIRPPCSVIYKQNEWICKFIMLFPFLNIVEIHVNVSLVLKIFKTLKLWYCEQYMSINQVQTIFEDVCMCMQFLYVLCDWVWVIGYMWLGMYDWVCTEWLGMCDWVCAIGYVWLGMYDWVWVSDCVWVWVIGYEWLGIWLFKCDCIWVIVYVWLGMSDWVCVLGYMCLGMCDWVCVHNLWQ